MRKLIKYKYKSLHWRFILVAFPIQMAWLVARRFAPNIGSYGPNSSYDLFLEFEAGAVTLYSAAIYLFTGWLYYIGSKRYTLASTLNYETCPSCGYDCSTIPDFTACPECGLTGNADRFREIWNNPKAR